jgi:ribonuclease HI
MVETFRICFSPVSNDRLVDRHIKWNNNNYSCVILNVDGSCLGSPIRSGFGGIIRNTFGHYLAGFSGFIPETSDILLVELYAIYKGLLLAREMSIDELACYSDSLHCVNLIKGPQVKYHIHAVLIQDIKELLSQANVSLHHTLREGNQCADFFAKLGATSDVDFLTHASPPEGVRDLLRNDAMGTFFLRD